MAYVVDWEVQVPQAREQAPIEPAVSTHLEGLLPSAPGGLCITASGGVVLSEPETSRVRWIEPAALTVIGTRPGLRDGSFGQARFRHPLGIAAAPDGSVVVADAGNHAIRRIEPGGFVRTLAGGIYGESDGQGDRARFRYPASVTVGADGTVVVADTASNTIRRIDTNGQVSTLAGQVYGQGDLAAGHPSFRRPEAVALGPDGSIYVADTGNGRICRIEPSGRYSQVAGRGGTSLSHAPVAELRWPTCLLVLPDSTIYAGDAGRKVIWRIDPDGTTTVFPSERGWRPVALALLPDGLILVAETHWSPAQEVGRLRRLR